MLTQQLSEGQVTSGRHVLDLSGKKSTDGGKKMQIFWTYRRLDALHYEADDEKPEG